MTRIIRLCAILVSVFVMGCANQDQDTIIWNTIQKSLQEQLIGAADGDTIYIPAGRYMFTKGLQLDGKKNILIKGAGKDSTILSFRNQKEGAQGILISNSVSITIEDMTLEDAPGDNLKINDTKGITIRRIRSRWNGEPKSTNGAYALYPVLCTRVVIEDCEAIGSSDAGIYVGQSDSVIIRRNKAWNNVAGIESENSRWVDIYENESFENTGGLLVFDLPGLTQYGHSTRIFNNFIHHNNYKNFASPGNVVASVPPGTGVMILATHNLEMVGNDIIDNKTIGTGIISYELVAALTESGEQNDSPLGAQTVNNNYKLDTLYNPYPYDIRIRKNFYQNNHWFPAVGHDIGLLFLTKAFLSTPDIAYDGIRPDASDPALCIEDNGEIKIVSIDAAHDFEGWSEDTASFRCRDTKNQ
ncbi:MAG: parallel beta-helix domain-containing protein [Cyclobacteriaceae bacterium]